MTHSHPISPHGGHLDSPKPSLRLDAGAFDDVAFDGVVDREDPREVGAVAIHRFLARLSHRYLKSFVGNDLRACAIDFLRDVGSRHDGLILLEDPEQNAVERGYGLVFNDVLGTLRSEMMAAAMRYRSPDGIVVVDDADREPDRWSAMRCARRNGLVTYDLRPWTIGFFGRWAILVAS